MLKTGKALSCALTLKVGKAQSHLSAKNRQSIELCSKIGKAWGSTETGSHGNSLLIPAYTSILMGHFCTQTGPHL